MLAYRRVFETLLTVADEVYNYEWNVLMYRLEFNLNEFLWRCIT